MNNGAFGENFPYSNFHDLNMDWIIKIAKDFLDQYTHIEETITNGESSLNEKIQMGLFQLDGKRDQILNLLDTWYTTHSNDIANELASALAEMQTTLTQLENSFNTFATTRTNEAIGSIPGDYTQFYAMAMKNFGIDIYTTSNPGDADNILTGGIYYNSVSGNNVSIINVPPIGPGTLIVAPSVVSNSQTCMQIYVGQRSGLIYNRSIISGVCRPWTLAWNKNVLPEVMTMTNATHNGITYAWTNCTCHITGVATGLSYSVMYNQPNTLPWFMQNNDVLFTDHNSPNVFFTVYWYINGTLSTQFPTLLNRPGIIAVPSNATGALIRYTVNSGTDLTSGVDVVPALFTEVPSNYTYVTRGVLPTDSDLDNIKTPGVYFLSSGNTYSSIPAEMSFHGGTLEVIVGNDGSRANILQRITRYDSDQLFVRTSINDSFTTQWHQITGNGSGTQITNNFTVEHYSNTYNITSSPTINSVSDNILPATGTTEDRTTDIQTLLNTGDCHLSAGTFYARGITIPAGARLRGEGNSTILILDNQVPEGYLVKMGSLSTIEHIQLKGQSADYTPDGSDHNRNGIIFEGDMSTGTDSTYRAGIFNCTIRNFSGSGIKCYETGGDVRTHLMVSDCNIWNCYAGINIWRYSEYHHFTNVYCQYCDYGVIDNGGNCMFSNCDFSHNNTGALIDNQYGQSRNDSHGTFACCSFNHSGNNTGTAIRIVGATNGEMFTGCQIFYGATVIEQSHGIRFVGCNYGRQTPIYVGNSFGVVFSACSMYNNTVTDSGNTGLSFSDCYNLDGTVFTH